MSLIGALSTTVKNSINNLMAAHDSKRDAFSGILFTAWVDLGNIDIKQSQKTT